MVQLPRDRYDDNIHTRNFRLKRTVGTRTKFTLNDKRTGISIGFDKVRVGMKIGRGDVIELYVEVDENYDHSVGGRSVATVYQHDVCDHLLEAFEHIEETGELPEADYVKEEL